MRESRHVLGICVQKTSKRNIASMGTVSSCRHVSFGPPVARTIGWDRGYGTDGYIHSTAASRNVTHPCARGALVTRQTFLRTMPRCACTALYGPVSLQILDGTLSPLPPDIVSHLVYPSKR